MLKTVKFEKFHKMLPALAMVSVAILVKTVLLMSILDQESLKENDSSRYLNLSENFKDVFFGTKAITDTFFITPGYPFFLSLFQPSSLKAVIFTQFLLLGISQLVIFKLIVECTSLKMGYLGLTLYLVESSTNLESFNILTETLFNFFLVIFLIFFKMYKIHARFLVLSGLFLGVALIVRPVGQIMLLSLVLMSIFPLWRKQALITLICALLVSSGWIVRNQMVFEVPQLSGIQSLNLLQYEGAGAYAKQKGITLQESQKIELKLESEELQNDSSIESVVDYRISRGIRLILENPLGFVKLHLEGVIKILYGPGAANITKFTSQNSFTSKLSDELIVLSILIRFLTTTLLFVSLFLSFKNRIFLPIQMFAIISWLLILISSGGANAYSRFRVPLIPLEVIIICLGLSSSDKRASIASILKKFTLNSNST